jgi:hypothetical protein
VDGFIKLPPKTFALLAGFAQHFWRFQSIPVWGLSLSARRGIDYLTRSAHSCIGLGCCRIAYSAPWELSSFEGLDRGLALSAAQPTHAAEK